MVSTTGLLNSTILKDSGNRLAYRVLSGEISREEELASIECYAWVPESTVGPDNTAPAPEGATTSEVSP